MAWPSFNIVLTNTSTFGFNDMAAICSVILSGQHGVAHTSKTKIGF